MSGGLRGPCARFVANDHGPVAYFPCGDQAILDVRVLAGERLGRSRAFALKDQQRAIRRIGKRTCEYEFAPRVRLTRKTQMLVAIRSAARDEIVDDLVKQRVITHSTPPLDRYSFSRLTRPSLS